MPKPSQRNRPKRKSATSRRHTSAIAAAGAALTIATSPLLAQESIVNEPSRWLAAVTHVSDSAESLAASLAGVWNGMTVRAEERLAESLGVFVLKRQAAPDQDAPGWDRAGTRLPEQVVLLIHGLDDPGTIWTDLAPALDQQGHEVVRFEYRNDQPIARSADSLWEALVDLRARGVHRVDIVAHSMGGLVARDVLTRPSLYNGSTTGHDDAPRVGRLIMIGTPNDGSELARLRGIMEWRDLAIRWASAEDRWDLSHLAACIVDGSGEAGTDLLPGSEFLTDLNGRPLPRDVHLTTIIGRAGAEPGGSIGWTGAAVIADAVLGTERATGIKTSLESIASLLGDGAVSSYSATLDGVDDVVYFGADHRSLVRNVSAMQTAKRLVGRDSETPPAFQPIFERLAESTESAR